MKERAAFFALGKTKDFDNLKERYFVVAKEKSKKNIKYPDTVVNPKINTAEYRHLFDNLDENPKVIRALVKSAKAMLVHRSGTKYEDLAYIDSKTGKYLIRMDYHIENEVLPSKKMRNMVMKSELNTIIAIHNHPSSSTPSITDLKVAYEKRYKYGLIVCHNGTVMKYEVTGDFNPVITNFLLDNVQSGIYNDDAGALQNALRQLNSENVVLEVFK